MYLACLSVVGNYICIRNATSSFSGNCQARSSYIRKLWEMFSDTAIINTLKLVRGFLPKRYKWLIFFIKKCRFCPVFFFFNYYYFFFYLLIQIYGTRFQTLNSSEFMEWNACIISLRKLSKNAFNWENKTNTFWDPSFRRLLYWSPRNRWKS